MSKDEESDPSLLVRHDWVSASHFHPVSQNDVLKEVHDRVLAVRAKASPGEGHPLVVLDLDSTLYEVAPRTMKIISEWIESSEAQPFTAVRDRLKTLKETDLGYSLRDTFRAVGLSLDDPQAFRAWESAKKFWVARFFRSAYVRYDRPYRGAAEFTRQLHAQGAEIVYLTGRDEPNMGDGTRENLIRDGFPWQVERTILMTKPNIEMTDLAHKRSAGLEIRERGTLIASFENEPVNLVALYELFPKAMHVFVETVCSDRGAKAIRGLYRIKGFA
jgi:phosphoglycolate phosphatase-like HAD superfamily hydrolase